MTMNMTDEELAAVIDQLPGAALLPMLRAAIYLEAAKMCGARARQERLPQIAKGLHQAADMLVTASRELNPVMPPPPTSTPTPTPRIVPIEEDGYTRTSLQYAVGPYSLASLFFRAIQLREKVMIEYRDKRMTIDARGEDIATIDQHEIPRADRWSIYIGNQVEDGEIDRSVGEAATSIAKMIDPFL